jgi:hypothetical protein
MGEKEGAGEGGAMTQTLYPHMNKINFFKKAKKHEKNPCFC